MKTSSGDDLTQAQNELYGWIKDYMKNFQHSPSIRQMMQAMGLKSPAPIQSRLKHLQEKGYISWQEGKARTMQIVDEIIEGVPIMGSVAAGGLIETFSDVQENLDLSDILKKKDIFALKDDPALIMWGIGNELNLRHENPKVWDAVNDLSKMIHQIDPNHLTTTMLAGAEPEVITQVAENCPDLDLLSFQIYGAIDKLPNYLQESNYQGAYMITEWGATGHWECENTTWDRPIEANSSKKANDYHSRYIDYIAADVKQCIGSFVFLWGQKQERTPTWYGLFLENEKSTEAAQVMQYLWTGKWAEHRIPKIGALTINNMHAEESVRLEQHKTYDAKIEITNPNKNLSYRWELMKEVDRALQSDGGDFEPTPETVWQQSDSSTLSEIQFSPPETGEFRLFVYVDDCYGGSATANMPILIES